MIKNLSMAVQWMNINLMAHLKREQRFGYGGHISSHSPIRTFNAKSVGILFPKGHIQLMCLSPNHASNTNKLNIRK